MTQRDESFRLRPAVARGNSKRDGGRFITRVLRAVNRNGQTPSRRPGSKAPPNLERMGRGAAGVADAGYRLPPNARRVVIKSRIVNLKRVSAQAVDAHLRYISRDGITKNGQPSQPYGPDKDEADWHEFAAKGRKDRHQFRFIVAPEEGVEIGDLRDFTRQLMSTMQRDLVAPLDWIAVDHWDTDNPHTHIVLRGRVRGEDLIIARRYLSDSMRLRACEIATDQLGPRTELTVERGLRNEVSQDRWTSLDRELQQRVGDGGRIDLPKPGKDVESLRRRTFLIGRLQKLERMGMARELEKGVWQLRTDAERVLRDLGERGDIIKTMHRALRGEARELALYDAQSKDYRIVGRIVSVGYVDELNEHAYLIVDGVDGRAHHIPIGRRDLSTFPTGGVVEVQPTPLRNSDGNIAELSKADGYYTTSRHREQMQQFDRSTFDPDEVIDSHVRRLEALRREGIVKREAEGIWSVPRELVARGHAYDRQRTYGVDIQLQSQQPIDKQVSTMAPTWLDRQLMSKRLNNNAGYGASVNAALRKRVEFLMGHGLAEQREGRFRLPHNLLSRLREREIEGLAKSIANETGKTHRRLADGQRASGVYRQMVVGASGRFALLDDGLSFSLVPWRPVIEQQLGRSISAVVRGDFVSWHLGRSLGIGM